MLVLVVTVGGATEACLGAGLRLILRGGRGWNDWMVVPPWVTEAILRPRQGDGMVFGGDPSQAACDPLRAVTSLSGCRQSWPEPLLVR